MKRIFLSLFLFILMNTVLFAHSKVETHFPADGEVLDRAPDKLVLNFKKPIHITKISITHANEDETHSEKLKAPAESYQNKFEFFPAFYGQGKYQVKWRALAKDGHVMKGDFSFTVKDK